MEYRLTAFGYDLIVGENQGNGRWYGGYRESGPGGSYTAVLPEHGDGFPDADSAKLATCRTAQALSGQSGQTVVDPCNEALSAWAVG